MVIQLHFVGEKGCRPAVCRLSDCGIVQCFHHAAQDIGKICIALRKLGTQGQQLGSGTRLQGTHQRGNFISTNHPKHGHHIGLLELAPTKGNGLIRQAQRVAHAALSRASNDLQGVVLKIHRLGGQYVCDVINDGLACHVFELKLQAPRQHGHRDFLGVCGGQQELHMLWWLFQGFQQRIKAGNRKHMNFVYQIDLVAAASRHVLGVFQQLPSIVDPGTRGGVYLDEIDKAILFYLGTDRACPAWRGTHALLAIQALGQNSCDGRFAHTPGSSEQIGMMQTIVIEGVG